MDVLKQINIPDHAIIVTDPPFNIGYHYNQYKDNMDDDEYYRMLIDLLNIAPCVFIHYPEALYKLSVLSGKIPNRVVSWVYNSNTAKQHRDIAFYGVKPNFNQVKNVNKEKTAHPCQMPLEVMKNIVGILPEDSIIIDPFMGSGTTGLACQELSRNFIGIELNEEYFNIAKDRLQ